MGLHKTDLHTTKLATLANYAKSGTETEPIMFFQNHMNLEVHILSHLWLALGGNASINRQISEAFMNLLSSLVLLFSYFLYNQRCSTYALTSFVFLVASYGLEFFMLSHNPLSCLVQTNSSDRIIADLIGMQNVKRINQNTKESEKKLITAYANCFLLPKLHTQSLCKCM